MSEQPSSNLVVDLRSMCECSGLSNPAGICYTCRAADEIERLRAALEQFFDPAISIVENLRVARAVLDRPADERDQTPEHLMKQGYRSGRAADEPAVEDLMPPDTFRGLKPKY